MTGMWIGPADNLAVGLTGFLVENSHAIKGWERIELRDLPAYTNQSHQPRLTGWCGTYNDVATHARGVGRVVRMARNGRAYVEILTGDELTAALEELGFPELDD